MTDPVEQLDPRQRLVFMKWCRMQADTCRAIAEQLDKTMVHGISDRLATKERQKAAAFAIVAMELAAVREECSVTAEDIGNVPTT